MFLNLILYDKYVSTWYIMLCGVEFEHSRNQLVSDSRLAVSHWDEFRDQNLLVQILVTVFWEGSNLGSEFWQDSILSISNLDTSK